MKQVLKILYWYLPYCLRRLLFRIRKPEKYRFFTKLRTEIPEISNASTYQPFIKNRCIFVQIPKVAGVSISKSLFGRHTGNHATVADYQIVFNKKEFYSFFKFAFVRNPWDRLVSAYIYLKGGGMNLRDLKWAEEYLSSFEDFNDFVLNWLNRNNIYKGIHFLPQYKFITCSNRLKPDVDFVGLFENINDDYSYIRNLLQLGDEKLAFENITPVKMQDYRSYYNNKTIQIVSEVYKEDIELLGYDFENSAIAKQISKRKLISNIQTSFPDNIVYS